MDIKWNCWRWEVGVYIAKYLSNTGRYLPAIALFQDCLQLAEYLPDPVEGKLMTYEELCKAHVQIKELEKALWYCQMWKQIAKDHGKFAAENSACVALAETYLSLGRFTEAVQYFRMVLAGGGGEAMHNSALVSYYGLGRAHHSLGNLTRAVQLFERGLEIGKKENNKFLEGELLFELGQAHRDLGEPQEAKECHEKQLALAKELGNKTLESQGYLGLGNYYHEVGEYEVAIECHTKQLAIAKEIKSKALQSHAFGALGKSYSHLGNSKKSIENLERSLEIAIEEGDEGTKGRAYGNLGNAYKIKGEYGKAIDYLEKSLKVAEGFCERVAEANAHGNLGSTYRSIGNYDKAIFHLKKDLEIRQEMGSRAREGMAYHNLGNVYFDRDDSKEARNYFEKALQLLRDTDYKSTVALICGNLGIVYLSDGDLEKALEYSMECLRLNKISGQRAFEGLALGNIGSIHARRGNYMKAIYYHEKSLTICRQEERKHKEANAYMMLGQDHMMFSELEEAKRNYLSAIKLCEEIQEHLGEKDGCKVSIGDIHDKAYKALSLVLLESEEHEEALVVVERGHSRALVDLMRSSYLIQTSRDTDGKTLCTNEIKKCVNKVGASAIVMSAPFDTCLFLWVVETGGEIHLRDASKQTHFHVGQGVKSLISSLYSDILVSQEEVQCEDRSLAVLYGGQRPTTEIEKQPRSREAFEMDALERCWSQMREMKLAEDANHQRAPHSSHESQSPLTRLYNVIIGPVADLLRGPEILVVPEGPFYLVPMAALRDDSGRFLSETFKIRVVPSLTTMKLIQESPADYHSESGALIVGDPNVGEVEFNGEIVTVGQLEFARAEAEMIGGLLSVTPLVGDQATKEEVLKQMTTVVLIHIAAHGNIDTGEIALAPNPARSTQIPKKEDFLLSMADVHKVRLRARLVVLSCCHSGRGKIKAEGVVGIARAFLGAGARSVLVSLWAIDDAATMEFMRSFYEHLHGGESASEALHQAMKCLRESQQFKDVKYWAPFVLMGDDVKLKFH